MPFEPGNKAATGGARPGAGRKPLARKSDLDALMDEAMPVEKRKGIIDVLANRAHAGQVDAAAFLFDRCYGKPLTTVLQDAIDEVNVFKRVVLEILQELDPDKREAVVAKLKERGVDC